MSANNHPERFPADADFTARNNRVAALIAKYKADVRTLFYQIDTARASRE